MKQYSLFKLQIRINLCQIFIEHTKNNMYIKIDRKTQNRNWQIFLMTSCTFFRYL